MGQLRPNVTQEIMKDGMITLSKALGKTKFLPKKKGSPVTSNATSWYRSWITPLVHPSPPVQGRLQSPPAKRKFLQQDALSPSVTGLIV